MIRIIIFERELNYVYDVEQYHINMFSMLIRIRFFTIFYGELIHICNFLNYF